MQLSPSPVLRRFADDTRGSVSLELLLVFPLLIWAYLGLFVYFDGYRQQNVNLKAAYTVADMLSRETGAIDEAYIEGLNKTMTWLTYGRQDTTLRVSVVTYDLASDSHFLVWSEGAGSTPRLKQENVATYLTPKIPAMPDGDTAIIVETWATYRPLTDVGLPDATPLNNFVVVSPRFVPQLLFVSNKTS